MYHTAVAGLCLDSETMKIIRAVHFELDSRYQYDRYNSWEGFWLGPILISSSASLSSLCHKYRKYIYLSLKIVVSI